MVSTVRPPVQVKDCFVIDLDQVNTSCMESA
jgi:hypothetical protein